MFKQEPEYKKYFKILTKFFANIKKQFTISQKQNSVRKLFSFFNEGYN